MNYNLWHYHLCFFDLFDDFFDLNSSFPCICFTTLDFFFLTFAHSFCFLFFSVPLSLSQQLYPLSFSAFLNHFALVSFIYSTELGFVLWTNLEIFLGREFSPFTFMDVAKCSEFGHTLLCHDSCFVFLFYLLVFHTTAFLLFLIGLVLSVWFFSC